MRDYFGAMFLFVWLPTLCDCFPLSEPPEHQGLRERESEREIEVNKESEGNCVWIKFQ